MTLDAHLCALAGITVQQADNQAQAEIATIVQQQAFRSQARRLPRELLPIVGSDSAGPQAEALSPILEQVVSSPADTPR